jgi:hypothetical protein
MSDLSRFALRSSPWDRLRHLDEGLSGLEVSMTELEELARRNANHAEELASAQSVLDEELEGFSDELLGNAVPPDPAPPVMSGGLSAYSELFELQKRQLSELSEIQNESLMDTIRFLETLGFVDARLQRKEVDNVLALMRALGHVVPQQPDPPQPEVPQPEASG